MLNNLFGFYYSYLGLVPVRNKQSIYFPTGKWKGWYFSVQLKFSEGEGGKYYKNYIRLFVV